jgi:cytosine/adenosine deaminase-related metal-dependent hydrolase
MTRQTTAFHVDWFITAESIQHDVTVRFGDGRIQSVEPGQSSDASDLGPVAMIPGLVNAHTHLEFSLLTEPIPTQGRFTDWIRSVVRYRREHPEQVPQAIRAGVQESLKAGTTSLGDIATIGWSVHDYRSAEFSGIVYQELIGLGDERVIQQQDLARNTCVSSVSDPSILMGLSPHAPYSVHPDLLRLAITSAAEKNCPVAMHLAETPVELELLSDGTGEFREMLTEFGIWREGLFGGKSPLDYLQALAECPQALVIHGNYLNDRELQFIAKHPQLTLVYCPRTHAAFGHSSHPWRRLLELGGSVAIGTDSRASNPDLSVFAELQFLAAQHSDLSHLNLLKLATRSLPDRLSPPRADLCLVQWDAGISPDPARNLFAPGNKVVGTIVGGAWRL